MQYLIATYWMWFVVALLAGGAVGYWLPGRRIGEGGIRHRLVWGTVACLAALAAAALHGFPLRASVDPEPPLLLAFGFAIGGLLGRSLRVAAARAELARAALDSHAQVERAVLGARAKAAVKSGQDAPAPDQAVSNPVNLSQPKPNQALENARLDVEAKAAEVMRVAAVAKARQDERLGTETKAAEEARIAAEAKIRDDHAREYKAREDKTREEQRLAAEAKAAEEARLAAARKAADKAAEDARLAAEVKAADELRLVAVARTKTASTEAVAAEKAEVSKPAVGRVAEDASAAAETRAAGEARLAAAVNAVQRERVAVEANATEKVRAAAAVEVSEPPVTATTAQPDASHPGRRPQGMAAAEGETDDLKLIKGIGPRNEKACNALGIYRFRQIADWTPEEAIWVGHDLSFPGRIEREHWIAQARLLASGIDTEHSKAVKSGAVTIDDKSDEPLDPAPAELLGKSLPEQAAAIDGERKHPGRRPPGLATALRKPDDLKRIRGIGPRNAGRLHELGIWHFGQVAAWTDENVKWVGSYLASSGRIQRDNWVAQARELAGGQQTDKAADKETNKETMRRAAAGKVAKDDGPPEEGSVQPPE